jgi:hypothetical protein
MEEKVPLKVRACGIVVRLERMRDAANRKIMGYGYAAIRRIPGNGAAAKHMPA